jgi:hypothetical protein
MFYDNLKICKLLGKYNFYKFIYCSFFLFKIVIICKNVKLIKMIQKKIKREWKENKKKC